VCACHIIFVLGNTKTEEMRTRELPEQLGSFAGGKGCRSSGAEKHLSDFKWMV